MRVATARCRSGYAPYRRGPRRLPREELHDIALGCEHVDLVGEEVHLYVSKNSTEFPASRWISRIP